VCRSSDKALPWIPHYFVTDELFDRHLTWLRQAGGVISIQEAFDLLMRKRDAHPLVYVITFDDGYYNNLSIACPILRAHGLPATVSLSTALIDAGGGVPRRAQNLLIRYLSNVFPELVETRASLRGPSDSDRPLLGEFANSSSPLWQRTSELIDHALLDTIRFMNVDEVRLLAKEGITLGSHTVNHPILSAVDPTRRLEEIVLSVKRVREWSDATLVPFAYPNGKLHDFDDTDIHVLRNAGIPLGMTTVAGVNRPGINLDIYRLFRLAVSQRVTRSDFMATLSGLYDADCSWTAP